MPKQEISYILLKDGFKLKNTTVADAILITSHLINTIVAKNDKKLQRAKKITITPFNSRSIPRISVADYLTKLVTQTNIEPPVLISVLAYLSRISDTVRTINHQGHAGAQTSYTLEFPNSIVCTGLVCCLDWTDSYLSLSRPCPDPTMFIDFSLNSYNVHRFLLAATVVSHKMSSDTFFSNSTYAKIGGIPHLELNSLEIQLLFLLNFKLVISHDEIIAIGTTALKQLYPICPIPIPISFPKFSTKSSSFNFQHSESDADMDVDNSVPEPNVYSEQYNEYSLTVPRLLEDVKLQLALEDDMDQSADTDLSLDSQDLASRSQNLKDVKKTLGILNGDSDVIRGVYEGGFKTWECSFDLLEYISSSYSSSDLENIRVLELGCGSAIPSLHIIKTTNSTTVHLQDYNPQVIKYITLPNVLLNTVLLPYIQPDPDFADIELDLDEVRGRILLDSPESTAITVNPQQPIEPSCSAVHELTDTEISTANQRLLSLPMSPLHRVKFLSGSWSNLPTSSASNPSIRYDLILSSETIYDTRSQLDLYHAIHASLARPDPSSSLFRPAAYIAAKSIYFGLSGSVTSFLDLVSKMNHFSATIVFQSTNGTQRDIIKLEWI
ncbi:Histidine protein methyltransferase 1-like protein [Smittium mucronatum]|uniref:Histidine protein methyltransferase 1-like protein n=1 Tax=Smittium mucronatum TaxID=133383 RepID=A0A1R0H4F1_9FUNG|nr:Histidine protein methyltransferase 1-like protein [Smittium mucronatum]